MTDSKLNKERIDEDLERLEIHSPSMRFTKSVVERVKLETNLISERAEVAALDTQSVRCRFCPDLDSVDRVVTQRQ